MEVIDNIVGTDDGSPSSQLLLLYRWVAGCNEDGGRSRAGAFLIDLRRGPSVRALELSTTLSMGCIKLAVALILGD
jgi:hypothetical protein